MMQRIRWFLLLFGIIVILVLSLWNSGMVKVQLPFVEDHELPLSMLLMATAATGFVFGAVMTGWMLRGRRKSAAAKEKQRKKEEAAAAKSETQTPTADSEPVLQ